MQTRWKQWVLTNLLRNVPVTQLYTTLLGDINTNEINDYRFNTQTISNRGTTTQENIKQNEENLKAGTFSMEDYLGQLRQMKKMGGMEGVLSMLPGVSKIKKQMDNANVDENVIKINEAIILSMTKEERLNPKIIDGSRKKRISSGSGADTATVNKLLKQFKMMTNMMKKMSKGDPKGGMPPEIFNQLK